MRYINSIDPSFYFTIYLINKYYPESNTIQSVRRQGNAYKIYIEDQPGELLCYRKLKYISDSNLRWKAYVIDFIMRLSGQGGSNIVICGGCCYTNWTTFYKNTQNEIDKVNYNPTVLMRLFYELGDLNEVLLVVQDEYNVDLRIIDSTLRSIWSY